MTAARSIIIDADGNLTIPRGTTLPTVGMIEGDIFYKTDTHEFYTYSGSAWTASAPLAHDHTTLTTPVTSVLYVDGGRGDTYVENGSITKPFKTIAAAEAVATAISTIRVCRKSAHYIENLTITNACEIIGDGDPVIQGTVTFTGNPKTINRMQVVGDITCANVVVTFEQCEVTGKITTSGTGQVKYSGGIIAPASGSAIVNGGAAIAINNALINVTGNVPGVDQTAGVVTISNCLVFGASATTEVVKSSGGQILISETVVQNLGGGAAISIPNGATTSPNILSNVTTIGNVVCGTAVTKVEGLTQATGTLTGSMLFFRPATMISNTPAGGIAATTVQAAINELDSEKANDSAVIHKSTAAEISAIAEKTVPIDADVALIEDSASSPTPYGKRRVQLSNLAGINGKIFSPSEVVYSAGGGGAVALAIDGTTRIYLHATRSSGSPVITVYAYGKIPQDFKSFVTNPLGVMQQRVGTITTSITMYKNGTIDSTINGISLGPGTSFAEATFTPGSTYAIGDEYLIVMSATLGNGLEYDWANLRLSYNRKVG